MPVGHENRFVSRRCEGDEEKSLDQLMKFLCQVIRCGCAFADDEAKEVPADRTLQERPIFLPRSLWVHLLLSVLFILPSCKNWYLARKCWKMRLQKMENIYMQGSIQ